MLSEREQAERREAMQEALASQRLEGLEPDAQTLAESEKWTRGEAKLDNIIAHFAHRVRRGEIRE